MRKDLEQVKKTIKGDPTNIAEERRTLLARVKRMQSLYEMEELDLHDELFSSMFKRNRIQGFESGSKEFFRNIIRRLDFQYTLSLDDLSSIKALLDMTDKIKTLNERKANDFKNISISLIEDSEYENNFKLNRRLLEKKIKESHDLTEQEIEDWGREYSRCKHSLSLLYVVGVFLSSKVNSSELEREMKMVKEVDRLLSDGFPFENEKEERVRNLLNDLKSINPLLLKLGISEKEREMIVKAMAFSRGHWFKCPKGHVYAIGECGGASEQSRCPECNAPIGGVSHRLEEGNEVATEMDGARFGAYSEAANLLFEGLNLDDDLW